MIRGEDPKHDSLLVLHRSVILQCVFNICDVRSTILRCVFDTFDFWSIIRDEFVTYLVSGVSFHVLFLTYVMSGVSFYDMLLTYFMSGVSFYDVFSK